MEYTDIIKCVVIVPLLLFIAFALFKDTYKMGYKKGQIDAMNGINKIKLIEFNDGSRDYYGNPKPEDFKEPFKIIKP